MQDFSDIENNIETIKEKAANGDADAQNKIGICYKLGLAGFPKDAEKAVEWFKKAAEKNNTKAFFNLAMCLHNGQGIEKNEKESAQCFKKAAELGHAASQTNLGVCYLEGRGLEQNYKKAVEWFTKAADQSYTEAQNNLGYCYESGKGIEKDLKKAAELYCKAAEQGHPVAQANLARCYEKGIGVEQDFKKAVGYYAAAADKNDSEAQVCLGWCFQNGLGVHQDYERAAELYTMAADKGHSRGQVNLGYCYEHGLGVEKSIEKAIDLYLKAAKGCDAKAMNNLGACFLNGEGVERNEKKAYEWFAKGAELGDVMAQWNLAYCYEHGVGVEQHYDSAIFWLARAAEQGDSDAEKTIKKILEKQRLQKNGSKIRNLYNIKLHPEDSCYVPGKGSEKEIQDIVSKYVEILSKRASDLPVVLKAPSLNEITFEKELDDAYDYIVNAANLGDIDAEYTLKEIFSVLEDFPNYFLIQDKFEANMWYATHGDIYAQGMLGDRYYHGKGVEKNFEEAVKWYKKSAEQGVKQAQYNLAGCLEVGCGVKQNKEEALKWYRKSAEKGLWEAKRAVKRIEAERINPNEEMSTYLPTNIWEGERDSSWNDEYGVTYSADGKRLLDAPKELQEYTVKDGTQVICDNAFYICKKLSRIGLPTSVVIIGSGAFKGCQSLKSIIFPPNLREIGEYAFEYSGLTSIEIPDSVKTIGDGVFRECYQLKTVSLPQSLEEIGKGIFVWCKRLKSITIDVVNPRYDSRENCNAIIETGTNILISGCNGTVIPNSVVKIGEDAQKRDEFFRKAQAVIDADTGLKDRIHTAVREHYSSSELLMVAADLYEKVRDRAYMPYWSSHCSTGPDGRIWNDIIEMYWNPGHRSWENMEQGRFMAAWPPAV